MQWQFSLCLTEESSGTSNCSFHQCIGRGSQGASHLEIRLFREAGEISVYEGQGRRPLLEARCMLDAYILVVGKDKSRLIASKIKVIFLFSQCFFFYIHFTFTSFFFSPFLYYLLYTNILWIWSCYSSIVLYLAYLNIKFNLHLHHFYPQVVFSKHFETVKKMYSNKQNNNNNIIR